VGSSNNFIIDFSTLSGLTLSIQKSRDTWLGVVNRQPDVELAIDTNPLLRVQLME
jgi:hypothetical protein